MHYADPLPMPDERKRQKGAILILVLVIMVALLFGATAFLAVVINERELAVLFRNQSLANIGLFNGRAHAIALLEDGYAHDDNTDTNGDWYTAFSEIPSSTDNDFRDLDRLAGMYPWDAKHFCPGFNGALPLTVWTPMSHYPGYGKYDPPTELVDGNEENYSYLIGLRWPKWHYCALYDKDWDLWDTDSQVVTRDPANPTARYSVRYYVSIIDLSGLILANRTAWWNGTEYELTEYANGTTTIQDYAETMEHMLWVGMGADKTKVDKVINGTSENDNLHAFVEDTGWRDKHCNLYNWGHIATSWIGFCWDYDKGVETHGNNWVYNFRIDSSEKTYIKYITLFTPFGNSSLVDNAWEEIADNAEKQTIKWQVNANTAPRKVLEVLIKTSDALAKTYNDGSDSWSPALLSEAEVNSLITKLEAARPFANREAIKNAVSTAPNQGIINRLVDGDGFYGLGNQGMKLDVGKSKFFRVMVMAQTYDEVLGMILVSRRYECVVHIDPDGSGPYNGNKLWDTNILYQHKHGGE